ncbi:MAG TPA: FAD-dependent oxidoreductase, partial [Pseudorhodoplanes sp.]|nr:FAD-dependent oxidoreductase [Pseudorhodoplanes sp.]
VAKLALAAGLDVYPAPPGQRLRVGRRYAREGELEDFLAALVRCNRAIQDAARGKADMSCLQALPKDLLDLQATVEFFLGPWGCGKDLREISVMDFAKSAERDIDAFCRQGFGTLLMKLAEGLPLELSAPVTQVNTSNRGGVEVVSSKGRVSASAVIVTASTNVLTRGTIKFTPDLPKRQLDACDRLSLGSYDRIILELPGNPLGMQRDDLMFEKSESARTAAVLANVGGSTLAFVDVGGKFGRDLAARGQSAMRAFATEWLTGLYGTDIGKAVGKTHATQWNDSPYTLGAFSAAAVGGQPSRRILMEPLRERVFFAGEAVHETLWGTVGGAWESGERAAAAALRIFGIGKPEPAPPPAAKRPRRQQR